MARSLLSLPVIVVFNGGARSMPFFRIKTTTNAGARRRVARNDIVVTVSRPAARTTTPALPAPRASATLPPAPRTAPPNAAGIDMCSSIFEVCRRSQREHLDPRGAACMFDVDGGRAPSWMVEALKAVIEMIIADIASGMPAKLSGAAVGITLRQSGGFWALAIAENVSGPKGAGRAARRVAMVRALLDRLDCVCRALPNPKGSTIAIAFPIAEKTIACTTGVLH